MFEGENWTEGRMMTRPLLDLGDVELFCVRPTTTASKIGPLIEGFAYYYDDGRSGDRMASIALFHDIASCGSRDENDWPFESYDENFVYNDGGADVLLGVVLDSRATMPACVQCSVCHRTPYSSTDAELDAVVVMPGEKKLCTPDGGVLSMRNGAVSCATEPCNEECDLLTFVCARVSEEHRRVLDSLSYTFSPQVVRIHA